MALAVGAGAVLAWIGQSGNPPGGARHISGPPEKSILLGQLRACLKARRDRANHATMTQKNRPALLLAFFFLAWAAAGQSYQSFFTGNPVDAFTNPTGGICLMGGSSENDEAMRWFLRSANGGDVLVLRASGADGYNTYFYSELGVAVNSVETLVFNNAEASREAYIHDKIQKAEAIWIAGGDQWNYVSYWRNTPVDSLIQEAIKTRHIAIGGTSAGMAVLGGFYFSARFDTVTSDTALANPYDQRVAVDSAAFLAPAILSNVITDTHYANRNRQGRHVAFLARILVDYGARATGIACDETVAVCIPQDGVARVFGNYPESENKAYFIQIDESIRDATPASCTENKPLDWNLGAATLKVFAVHGTMEGTNTFDLNDWKTGTGGQWEYWSVAKGLLKIEKE